MLPLPSCDVTAVGAETRNIGSNEHSFWDVYYNLPEHMQH